MDQKNESFVEKLITVILIPPIIISLTLSWTLFCGVGGWIIWALWKSGSIPTIVAIIIVIMVGSVIFGIATSQIDKAVENFKKKKDWVE